MIKYTAKMQHSEETIKRLVLTQYGSFQYWKKLLRIALALGMIAFGILGSGELVSTTVCLLFGCILLTGLNTRPNHNAKMICAQMKGQFPSSDYSFTDKGFRDHDGGELIAYSGLVRLVEDREYMYLYISTQSAYMVDKSTVSGDGAEGLKSLIAAAAGLRWTKPVTLMNFSIRTVFAGRRDKGFEGYRLK